MKIKIFLDEAWRWPLAWPVVVGGIIPLDNFDKTIFTDSKKISENKRQKIFNQIQQLEKEQKLLYAFWFSTNKEIDKYWIIKAINLATQRCILALFSKYINHFEKNILQDNNFFNW